MELTKQPKVIFVTNVPDATRHLRYSLDKFNWDYEVIVTKWQGFYTKINEAYKWCLRNTDEYFMLVDGHDVIFCKEFSPIEFSTDGFFSAEKNCYPNPLLSAKYPKTPYEWRFLNSGSYIYNREKFIDLYERNIPFIGIDDQLYFTELFLKGENISLDTNCQLFQSIAFESEGDFSWFNQEFHNLKTDTYPTILHGNGKADMRKIKNWLYDKV